MNTLRSRGFELRVIDVDLHKSLMSLLGKFPGVERAVTI